MLLGAGVMFVVGALDDLREVSPPAKIAGMVLGGSVLSLLGVTMLYFRVPFAGTSSSLSPDLAPLVTVLVGGRHDQRDQPHRRPRRPGRGHRRDRRPARSSSTPTGCSTDRRCSAPTTSVRSSRSSRVGVCVGFLPHNFNPARIFMGDGGALLLGLLHGGRPRSRRRPHRRPVLRGQTYFFFAPLFIPLFILGVPILDTLFSILRRATQRDRA